MDVQQTLSGGARGGGGGLGEGRYPGGGLGGVATTLQGAGAWRPGVGGIVQRPYNKDHGFCVFWDYITGLPKRNGSKIIGKVRRFFLLRDQSAFILKAHGGCVCTLKVCVLYIPYFCPDLSCRAPLWLGGPAQQRLAGRDFG